MEDVQHMCTIMAQWQVREGVSCAIGMTLKYSKGKDNKIERNYVAPLVWHLQFYTWGNPIMADGSITYKSVKGIP